MKKDNLYKTFYIDVDDFDKIKENKSSSIVTILHKKPDVLNCMKIKIKLS